MPLIHLTYQNNGLRLAVWEMENYQMNSLEKQLADTYFSESIKDVKLQKRRNEIIGTKLLKRTLGLPSPTYAKSGKPLLENGHISISHSENLIGIIHADFLIGLDLQIPSEKLIRVKHKFCNSRELALHDKNPDSLVLLTIIWSTKEAVYKMYGEELSFEDHMDVQVLDDKRILCSVESPIIKAKIELTYFWLKGQVVVFTSNEM